MILPNQNPHWQTCGAEPTVARLQPIVSRTSRAVLVFGVPPLVNVLTPRNLRTKSALQLAAHGGSTEAHNHQPDRPGVVKLSLTRGQPQQGLAAVKIFNPSRLPVVFRSHRRPSTISSPGIDQSTSPAPITHEDDARIAGIVARVFSEMQTRAPAEPPPPIPQPTMPGLREFLESVALPAVAKKLERDARELTVRRFTERVGVCSKCRISWRMDAGENCPRCNDTRMLDPGIDLVDSAALKCLADSLLEDELSPGTVRKYMAYLMTVLNKAAELGICRKAKKPRVRQPETVIRILSEAELLALYAAADSAVWPRHEQFSPADWWKALFVFEFVYGLRIGEATALPWYDDPGKRKLARGIHAGPECPKSELVHLGLTSERGWLVYLPAKQSDAKPLPLVLPLRDVAADHLDRIRGPRRFVFDCYSELRSRTPGDYRDVKISLYRQWYKLCDVAGIPADRRATPHDLRRTQESHYDNTLGKGIGGEVNGHAARSVSDAYYSQAVPRIHKAVLSVPLPEFPR